MKPIKVVIADDHLLFREGLKRLLSSPEKDISIVGEAASCLEAVQVTTRTQPDILLMDLKMPSGDAAESLAELGAKSPATKVIILTAYAEDENVVSTAQGRARGYILKGISASTLIEAICKVNAGEVWVDPEVPAGTDFSRIACRLECELGSPGNETVHGLTKRELEILHLVAEGLSNDEIGKRIFISRKTVKTHLTNVFDKLHVNNRFKAALCIMPSWKK